MRTLAIDLGAKRIGLALSDEGGRFATPYEVLIVTSPADALDAIVKLAQKEAVERLVVGLPLNMDDTMGPAANTTLQWATGLAARTSKPVVFVDERLSSFAAEQRLNERKRAGERMTRGGKKKQLDAVAAAMFLQEFLDGKLAAIELPSTKTHAPFP
jgi:putative Holliday junction resolvase